MKGYDNIPENEDMLLDLPFYEGVGTVTRDQAKPHHQNVLLVNTPAWAAVPGGLGIIAFDNTAHDYLELANAACVDLDFIAGDYSLGCWFNWGDTGTSLNIMGRYELNIGGWELYLFGAAGINYLTLRHHHAGTLVGGNPRSACYSTAWLPNKWWFIGISRTGGGEAQHYRNGIPVTMFTGGLADPETSGSDLVVGARYSKDTDFFLGGKWRPRIWDRALSALEWMNLFEKERAWFGV